MPRELTDYEKEFERKNLLDSGQKLLFRFGIRRVSVDDITKEAGVAKGTFYNYFESKDNFIYEVIYQIHVDSFRQFKQGLVGFHEIPKDSRREVLKKLFFEFISSPEIDFFIVEQNEMNNFLAKYSKESLAKVEGLERKIYAEILTMIGVSESHIAILQNYIHIIIFGISKEDLLNKEAIHKTVEIMFDGLLDYLEV